MAKYALLCLSLLLASCGGNPPSSVTPTPDTTPTPSPDLQAPTVSIQAPTTATNVDSITVSAEAVDNVGVTAVEFFLDGKLMSRVTTAPFTFMLGKLDVGKHELYAKAFDGAQNIGYSTIISLEISRKQTVLSGNIDSNTTLHAANSPYFLPQIVQVGPNATLTIEPGVEIIGSNSGFQVHGTLNAIGTSENPIIFRHAAILASSIHVPGSATTTIRHSFIDHSILFMQGFDLKGNLIIEDSVIDNTDSLPNPFLKIGQANGTSLVLRKNIIKGAKFNFDSYWFLKVINNHISGSGELIDIDNLDGFSSVLSKNTILGKENSVTVGSRPFYGTQEVFIGPNYWGTSDPVEIQKIIYDGNDNYGQTNIAVLQDILLTPDLDTPSP